MGSHTQSDTIIFHEFESNSLESYKRSALPEILRSSQMNTSPKDQDVNENVRDINKVTKYSWVELGNEISKNIDEDRKEGLEELDNICDNLHEVESNISEAQSTSVLSDDIRMITKLTERLHLNLDNVGDDGQVLEDEDCVKHDIKVVQSVANNEVQNSLNKPALYPEQFHQLDPNEKEIEQGLEIEFDDKGAQVEQVTIKRQLVQENENKEEGWEEEFDIEIDDHKIKSSVKDNLNQKGVEDQAEGLESDIDNSGEIDVVDIENVETGKAIVEILTEREGKIIKHSNADTGEEVGIDIDDGWVKDDDLNLCGIQEDINSTPLHDFSFDKSNQHDDAKSSLCNKVDDNLLEECENDDIIDVKDNDFNSISKDEPRSENVLESGSTKI